ncbi:MAG: DUF4374 domain-containing protein [Mangrovibacterium sp.]
MKLFKYGNKLAIYALALTALSLTTACSDDNNKDDEYNGDDAFVLTLAYAPTSGYNYDYYTVQFEDVMSGTLSAAGKGFHQLGYFSYDEMDDQIYSTGGLETSGIIGLKKANDGSLVQFGGALSFDSSLRDVVETDDENLLGVEISSSSDVVKLHIINPSDLSVSSSKQFAVSNLTSFTGPNYSGMVQSGNYMYLSFYISDPTTYTTAYTDQAQVAVFTYPGLQFVSVVNDDRTGPIGGFGTKSGLIKDDSGNVYALSHSNPANGFSQFTQEAAILRINKNTTSFDQNYFFSFDDVTGGKTTASLVYLGNGKVFAQMNQSARADQLAWSDSPLKPAVLDLTNKTINYITGIPQHSGIGRKLASTSLLDGNYLYMAIPEDVSTYIYKIDLKTYTATKGAEVEANFVAGFFKL